MARKCVFCGQSPITGEHVFPDWLRRHQKIREPLEHRQIFEEHGEVASQLKWSDQPYKMRAKAVCAECNHGWMSDLEMQVKPLLVGMLEGRGRELHRDGQQNLATWALKTAMMLDQASLAAARSIFPSFYRSLLDHGKPPSGVRIWMASYGSLDPGFTNGLALEVTTPGNPDPPERNLFVRTFNIGPVLFQVLGTTSPNLQTLKVDWSHGRPRSQPPVHQIWPFFTSFTWRPQPAFNDREIRWFSEMIVANLIDLSEVFEP